MTNTRLSQDQKIIEKSLFLRFSKTSP